MYLKKDIGISEQIRETIGKRILLCLLSFFIIIIGLTVFDIAKSFNELGETVHAQCQSLEDFTIGQALIGNQQAVQIKLNSYNSNNPYQISWVPSGSAPHNNSIHWLPLMTWEYNYQIRSVAGQNFGYFHVVGSLLNDKDFFSELLGRVALVIFFVMVMFVFLYPLANKIPEQLFIEPINSILALLKTGALQQPKVSKSKRIVTDLPVELVEIQDKIMQLLQEISEKTKLAALGELASQVAHDIRSPTSSLQMLEKACQQLLPERERIALREATQRILDIANNLLNQYKQKDLKETSLLDGRQVMLVSASLLQLISEKRMQYQNLSLEFDHKFTSQGNFAFIKIDPADFNRMISNIVNNAVDALNKKAGKIILQIEADKEWVRVIIIDNGSGMPPELVKKIMNNIAVTEGKKDGHGIGLTQVREVLQRYQGKFEIESKVGKGTRVILIFPRFPAPNWIAETINLGVQDLVIILDDDNSIHFAWDKRFETVLKQAADIKVQHFKQGQEALDYINNLSEEERVKIFLLTDYELLKQELNGLDVVAKCGVKRSVLVTSHYTNKTILDRAVSIGTKVLPKQLASEIPIKIDKKVNYFVPKIGEKVLKKVDLILIDDDKGFTDNLKNYIFMDKAVDCYQDPRLFFEEAAQYPKDTKICIDNNFEGAVTMKGLDVAKKLHELGFTKLYLLSGNAFKKEDLPDYLTAAILKEDVEAIKNI